MGDNTLPTRFSANYMYSGNEPHPLDRRGQRRREAWAAEDRTRYEHINSREYECSTTIHQFDCGHDEVETDRQQLCWHCDDTFPRKCNPLPIYVDLPERCEACAALYMRRMQRQIEEERRVNAEREQRINRGIRGNLYGNRGRSLSPVRRSSAGDAGQYRYREPEPLVPGLTRTRTYGRPGREAGHARAPPRRAPPPARTSRASGYAAVATAPPPGQAQDGYGPRSDRNRTFLDEMGSWGLDRLGIGGSSNAREAHAQRYPSSTEGGVPQHPTGLS